MLHCAVFWANERLTTESTKLRNRPIAPRFVRTTLHFSMVL
jgi:hypothetical protein